MTDQIDHRIIAALSRNARRSMSALAQFVGLSKTPVQARLRKPEANGIIRGYGVRVDHARFGRGHIAFNAAIRKVSEIEERRMIAASFDYLLKVRTSEISHYRRMLGEAIAALPHVATTSAFVVMEAVKEN